MGSEYAGPAAKGFDTSVKSEPIRVPVFAKKNFQRFLPKQYAGPAAKGFDTSVKSEPVRVPVFAKKNFQGFLPKQYAGPAAKGFDTSVKSEPIRVPVFAKKNFQRFLPKQKFVEVTLPAWLVSENFLRSLGITNKKFLVSVTVFFLRILSKGLPSSLFTA